jgi:uncharacterized membrane protein
VLFFITFVVLACPSCCWPNCARAKGAVMSTTAENLLRMADAGRLREQKFARKRVNQIALTLSLAAMAFGLFWLIWILWDTVRLGVGGMAWPR